MTGQATSATSRLLTLLRLPRLRSDDDLLDARRLGPFPAWSQIALVAALFVVTILLTHAEFVAHGTVFGFPGPAANVLVAPIYEELIFRGFILGRLARRLSSGAAVAISGLLFGLLHLRLVFWLDDAELLRTMLFTGLVAGPFWGWVTLRCRSVWPAVILHQLNNLAFFV